MSSTAALNGDFSLQADQVALGEQSPRATRSTAGLSTRETRWVYRAEASQECGEICDLRARAARMSLPLTSSLCAC